MAATSGKASSKNQIDKGPVVAWTAGLLILAIAVGAAVYFLRPGKTLYEVTGRVTRSGAPIELPSCRISFLNMDKGIFAPAILAPDGKYRVFSHKESGLPPGSYEIVVSFPMDYLPPTKTPTEPFPPDELERRIGKFIPKKYRDPKTSGLKLEVKDEDVVFDVDMTD